MKVIISQSDLLEALTITGKVIQVGGPQPILSNYLLNISKDSMLITGSNMETFISKPAKCESDFDAHSLLIPSERFKGVISCLPEQDLRIEIGDKNIEIIANEGKYLIPHDDAVLYPSLSVTSQHRFTANLYEPAGRVLFCCLQVQTSPFFGIIANPSQDGITLTGCNGAVLSSVNVKVDNIPAESFLIRQSTLQALENSDAQIELSQNNISFTFESGTVIKSVLLDMKYPNWGGIIPKNDLSFTVNRAQLIGSLKRVVQFSESLTSAVRLEISSNDLMILADNNLSEKASEGLTIKSSDFSLNIAVNGRLFIQALEKINQDEIEINVKNEKTAMVINQDNHLVLLMPFKL